MTTTNEPKTNPEGRCRSGATEKTTDARSPRSIRMLSIEAIDPDPNNRPIDEQGDDFSTLVDSVRVLGVLDPIQVRAEGERFQLVDGERRWRAARNAGLEEVPCYVWSASVSSRETLIAGVVLNEQRQAHSCIHVARRLRELKVQNALTGEQVAAVTGLPLDRVKTYEKLVGEVRGYLPLGGRVVVAARGEFGQIFVQGDYGSPITRRFYLGGPDTHRGFNYNRLSTQIPSGLAGSPALPIGGDEMFLAQLELRVRVARIFGYWLETAVFVDGGDVAEPSGGHDRIDFTRLHYAAGGGLRYKTVIGTLRADLGVRLNRLATTEPDGTPNPDPGSRFAFHLSIGEPF